MRAALVSLMACVLWPAAGAAQVGNDPVELDPDERIVILFDQSGSMSQPLDGVPKMELARQFFAELVPQIEGRDNVAVHFFAQDLQGAVPACEAALEILPLGVGVSASDAARVEGALQASGARTNIEHALRQGRAALEAAGGGRLILISDGLENCTGDPAGYIEGLPGQPVDVIALGSAADLSPLADIAFASDNGSFHTAESPGAFAAAMGSVMPNFDFSGLGGEPAPDAGDLVQTVEVDTGVEECPAFDTIQQQMLDYVDGSVAMTSERVEGTSGTAVGIEFIFDSSGSMAGRVGGEVKMDVARRAFEAAIRELEGANVVMGLRAYGFDDSLEWTAEASCPNTEMITPFLGGDGVDRIIEASRGLTPYGYTPIDASLAAAINDLIEVEAAERMIVLITDGEETCGGDPVARAQWASDLDVDLSTFVVGFDLEAAQADQMRAIAEAGGGRYFDAPDADRLTETLREVVGVTIERAEREAPSCENPVRGGETLEEARAIAPGLYTVDELLDVDSFRYYRIDSAEGQMVTVRGLLQSYRYVDGPDGPFETESALGALSLRLLNDEGRQVGTRRARVRDIPGSSAVAHFVDTRGGGVVLAIGDPYERLAPETLFEVSLSDVSDGAGGDAPGAIAEAGPAELSDSAQGHLGYDDAADVWRASAGGATTVTVELENADMRYDVAVYDAQTRQRLGRGAPSVAFEHAGDVLIELRSREPELDPKFSAYTIRIER